MYMYARMYVCKPTVKSGSSRLMSDRGSGGEMEVSHRGGLEVQRRYESGELSKDLV